jgi:hypothetical protein
LVAIEAVQDQPLSQSGPEQQVHLEGARNNWIDIGSDIKVQLEIHLRINRLSSMFSSWPGMVIFQKYIFIMKFQNYTTEKTNFKNIYLPFAR